MDEKNLANRSIDSSASENETETETTADSSGSNLSLRDINLFVRDLVVIIAIIVSLRFFVVTPFEIRGSSMEATYHDEEYIIADKLSYFHIGDTFALGNPDRGDVVVFHPGVHGTKEFYIKRVIGLPGDSVRFENGDVFLTPAGSDTEVMLDESYLSDENNHKTFLPAGTDNDTFLVPSGEYFLMGDNRNNSSDSRSCFLSCFAETASHYVPRANIIGKVFLHLGHFDAFAEGSYILPGSLTFTNPPRFFSTNATWDYPEIDAITSGSGSTTATGATIIATGSTATGS